MALANFFDKAALSASQILKGFDRSSFEKLLAGTTIEVVFDKTAAAASEGRWTLDLLVRLLSRLYPTLVINSLDRQGNKLKGELEDIALRINPAIDLKGNPGLSVVVGAVEYHPSAGSVFYIGSDRWITHFSKKLPVNTGNSNNPFGAAAAACFGAANVFREVFKAQLPFGATDDDFSLSIFSLKKCKGDGENPIITSAPVVNSLLVGLGAIGNATIWTLSRFDQATGTLTIVDDEKVGLSNLQRYILTEQDDIDHYKTEVAYKFLAARPLSVIPESLTWQDYLVKRNNFKIDVVAAAVDSASDRIHVQGALPRVIFNSWTQPEDLGISRHTNFLDKACLACLYLPNEQRTSQSQEVATNLGLHGSDNERIVRGYLANSMPVDQALLSMIAQANSIDESNLTSYIGKHIDIFYSEVVCGGVLMTLAKKSAGGSENMQVPSAFESALAGILLAAEIVIESNQLSREISNISRINLMRPLSDYVHRNHLKHHSNRCICQDDTYREIYHSKYPHK